VNWSGGWAALYLSSVGAVGAVTPAAIAPSPEGGSSIGRLCEHQNAGSPFEGSLVILAPKFIIDSNASFQTGRKREEDGGCTTQRVNKYVSV